MRVRRDEIRWANGRRATMSVIERKAGVTVLPISASGSVFLVREFKYGIGAYSLEAISGGIETDETPLEAATRELEEEIGLKASQWQNLGLVHPFSTAVHAPNHLFIARGLAQGAPRPDDTEFLERLELPLAAAVERVLSGDISHAASCVVLLRAARDAHL